MGFSSYYSEKINPILKENLKRYYTNLYQLKKLFFENENKNINLPKKRNENLSVSSLKNFINVQNKKNNIFLDYHIKFFILKNYCLFNI